MLWWYHCHLYGISHQATKPDNIRKPNSSGNVVNLTIACSRAMLTDTSPNQLKKPSGFEIKEGWLTLALVGKVLF